MNLQSFLKKLVKLKASEASPVYLTNTLRGQKERFVPLKAGEVRMYNCGPTVYDFAHIGNFRSFVFVDTLRRTLEKAGYRVRQIMNLTDIGHLSGDTDAGEDKMVATLRKMGLPETLESLKNIGTTYADAFVEDLKKLNIKTPDALPRASEHIAEQIRLIETLVEKGYAYPTKKGVYFDIRKFPEYGKLGGLNLKGNEAGARVEVDPEKHDPRDFVLWKTGGAIGWESPWGAGFPGWHIECSAMSVKYLGQPFDIHTGGIDHIPLHHQNEIAQSESAAGKPLARYWLHNEFLTVRSEKMAKSAGTFLTLRDLEENGYDPLSLRYLYLTAHYRSPIDFTWESLKAAGAALNRLRAYVSDLPKGGKANAAVVERIENAFEDDLDTPKSLAILWEYMRSEENPAEKRATLLAVDDLFGLRLSEPPKTAKIPPEIEKMVSEREKARKKGDWEASDRIRAGIIESGYRVEDTPLGPKISRSQADGT